VATDHAPAGIVAVSGGRARANGVAMNTIALVTGVTIGVASLVGCVGDESDPTHSESDLTAAQVDDCASVDSYEVHPFDGVTYEDNDSSDVPTLLYQVSDASSLESRTTNYENSLHRGDQDWFRFRALDETYHQLAPWVRLMPLATDVESTPGSLTPLVTLCAYPVGLASAPECALGSPHSIEDPTAGTLYGCCASDVVVGQARALELRALLADGKTTDESTDVVVSVTPAEGLPDTCLRYSLSWGGRPVDGG
jgi:hypothetical protein